MPRFSSPCRKAWIRSISVSERIMSENQKNPATNRTFWPVANGGAQGLTEAAGDFDYINVICLPGPPDSELRPADN